MSRRGLEEALLGGGCSGIANYIDLNNGGGGRNTKGKVTVSCQGRKKININ